MSDQKYIKIGTPAMRVVEECGEILKRGCYENNKKTI